MNILAFADMHGNYIVLDSIEKKSKEADIILNCGDFTLFQKNQSSYLERFEALKKPMLIIPGNHELEGSLIKACANLNHVHCLIDCAFIFERTMFLGAEGDCFSCDSKRFEQVASGFRDIIEREKDNYDHCILMTHAPPFGTKLDISKNAHSGSHLIRRLIEDTQPHYSFHGHIHRDQCEEDRIGETIAVNPGPYGVLIDI